MYTFKYYQKIYMHNYDCLFLRGELTLGKKKRDKSDNLVYKNTLNECSICHTTVRPNNTTSHSYSFSKQSAMSKNNQKYLVNL